MKDEARELKGICKKFKKIQDKIEVKVDVENLDKEVDVKMRLEFSKISNKLDFERFEIFSI